MSYKSFLAVSLLIITMIFVSAEAVFADSYKFNDIKGHWAEDVITNWIDNGLIRGNGDNTMRPDSQINRAEFVTMVNRAFAISNDDYSSVFIDVPEDEWFFKDVSAAKKLGYISGYTREIFKPYDAITREQAATMIAGLLTLELNNKNDCTSRLRDYSQLSNWSIKYVEAVLTKGIMNGCQDNTFQPGRNITRAEAIVTIDRAVKAAGEIAVYDQPGTYGPEQGNNTIDGNVIISSADVTLKNTMITGNLLFAVGIGEGEVTLKNVTVEGNTIIKGGGSNSITLENCTLSYITVTKDGVRVVASGNTSVEVVKLESGATLVEVSTTGPGFENVTISREIPSGAAVNLSGDFKEVSIQANINVEVQNGTVENMNITQNVDGSTVVLSKQSTVKNLTADGPVNIKGEGKIYTANINSNNVVIEPTPVKTVVSPGVTNKAGGKEISSTSGGGGSHGDSTVRVQSITLDQQNQKKIVGTTFQLTVTFDPVNATNKNITWESDNSVVATVYSYGLIKTAGAGIATITATSGDGNKKATTRVTVNNPGAVDPVVAREVAATEVHEGETLAESTLTGIFKDADDNTEVTGTLAWIDEETVATETAIFEWVFTPTDISKYNVITGTASVTVKQGLIQFPGASGPFMYTVTDGKAEITSYWYMSNPKDVVIPGNMCGYPVTSIGDKAFYDNQLTSVIIPYGVTGIGSEAFANNQLTSVTIPGSVTGIGNNAFAGNQQSPADFKIYGLKGSAAQIYADSNNHVFEEIFSYTINDGGAGIYNYSEAGPKDVVIPDSLGGYPVTKIWDHAFYGKHISSVTIPGSVTSIGRDAFSYNQLTSVIIPDGVASIDGYAFSCNQLTSVSIPDSVSSIDMGVFAYNNLTRVYIPDSVKSIGDYAFNDNQLTFVTIPGSVTSIGSTAFINNQEKSADLTIYGVKGSAAQTYADSNYYTFAEIPVGFSYTVTSDGEAIITGYSSDAPKDVVIPADLGGYPVTSIGNLAFYLKGLTSLSIPDSVKNIGIRAFEDNWLTHVTIPNSVTSIGNYAFFINRLSSVNIPNGVTSIGYDAFARNYLSSVTIPDSVTSIGSEAFAYNSLTSVIIPGGVTSIGSNAFEYDINQKNPAYLTIYGVIGSAAQTYAESYNHTFVGGPAEEFSYTVTNGEAKITEYNSAVHRDVVIPGKLGGYPVTSIGDHSFENKLLTSVIIPDSVTSIGDHAFASNRLTFVSIPGNVKSIGKNAFQRNQLNSVTIPNGLTSIEDDVFASNYIESVTIPDSVTSIGQRAFYSNLLTSITIPDSVTSIGYWAFVYNKLKTVTIPGSVTSIGEGAFNGNQENYADFTIYGVAGSAAETYADINNHTFEEALVGFSYIVTDGEAKITDYSSEGSKDVVIPRYLGGYPVTSIGGDAFSGKQLTSVFIPDSVTSIGSAAFYDNKLTSVKILDGMTIIEGLAFARNQLTSVIIPDSVTGIGGGAFDYNQDTPADLTICGVKGSAAQTYAAGNNHTFAELQLHEEFTFSVTYHGGAKILSYSSDGPKDVVIPDNFYGYPVTSIVSGAFYNKQLTSVIIPDGIKSIGSEAFESNQLTSVTIPDSVTSIGGKAFSNNQLTSVIIPDGVTSIEERVFEYNKLISVIIPDGVTSIGGYAFVWNQLTNITISGSVTSIGTNAFFANPWDMIIYGVKDSAAQTYAGSNNYRFKEIPVGFSYTVTDRQSKITDYSSDCPKDVVIPDYLGGYPVTSIGDWAFLNSQLTSVIIPNRITSIGDGAFAHNKLTSVSIPDGMTSIGGEVFSYNELSSIIIPESVTSIGGGAFESNQLTSLTIPGSVISIGDKAFYNNQLTTVIIHDGVTSIGTNALADNQQNPADLTIYGVKGLAAQNYADSNNHTFAEILPKWLWFSYTVTDGEAKITDYSIDGPKDVVIPDNLYGSPVTSFGGRAFAYNHLTSVIIPDGVTGIEGGAFEYNRLTSLIIPDSVISIGERAFSYNELTSVIIPESVTSIGILAFAYNQQNPADITIYGVAGSAAQTYAESNKHTFVEITEGFSCTATDGESKITDNNSDGLEDVIIPDGVTGSASQADGDSNNHTFAEIPVEFSYIVTDGEAKITGYSADGPKEVVIPGNLCGYPVTSIGDHAFDNNQLTSVTIPESVYGIGDYAFSNNELTSVIIPFGVTSIGSFTFSYNQLTSVTISESVYGIGENAFSVNELTSVIIPDSVTSIGNNAFGDNQTDPANLTIYGVAGSAAQTYADSNYHTFAEIPVGFTFTVTNDGDAIIMGYSLDAPKDVVIPSARLEIALTECKGKRELDCETYRSSRYESRA